MGIIELLLISVGLAMDAFSVSVCCGLAMKEFRADKAFFMAVMCGGFQAVMPAAGYFAGRQFAEYIEPASGFAAFVILAIIGGKMVYSSLRDKNNAPDEADGAWSMIVLAFATSIDAFAVGIIFSSGQMSIIPAVSVIGGITAALSFAGTIIGHIFGSRFGNSAETAGGAVLILLGLKFLLA